MSRQVPLPARVRRPGALSAGCLALAHSEGESDSICPRLSGAGIAREQIGRGDHFSGEYAKLADRILAFARSAKL